MCGKRYTNIKSYFNSSVAERHPHTRKWKIFSIINDDLIILYSNDTVPLFAPVYIYTFKIHNPTPRHKNVDYVYRMENSAYPESIADKLRYFRCKNGYRQNEISDYINVDRSTYIRYEENDISVYPIDKIELLAKLYDVDISELLDEYHKFLYDDQALQIKKLRKRLSLTQLEMARLLNVSLSALKEWEQNKVNMSKENYLKIRRYLV